MSYSKTNVLFIDQRDVAKLYNRLFKTGRHIVINNKKCPLYETKKGLVAITGLTSYPSKSFLNLIN